MVASFSLPIQCQLQNKMSDRQCFVKRSINWWMTPGNIKINILGMNTETPPRAAASSLLLSSYMKQNKGQHQNQQRLVETKAICYISRKLPNMSLGQKIERSLNAKKYMERWNPVSLFRSSYLLTPVQLSLLGQEVFLPCLNVLGTFSNQ